MLLEGPAGIGKTAVLRTLLDRAATDGLLVLSCAPTESETALPLAALADLLSPLADRIADLPVPQRIAAEAALLAGDHGAVDERALGAATRTLIEDAATATGVLVAVDDAPWLDRPSERALRFALRRVSAPLATLVTCRTNGAGPGTAPLGLDGALLTHIGLAPLGVGALHHVLHERFGVTLSRPLLARIARDAGGNPLLAIELARAVLRLPSLPLPGEDLPVVASMQELVGDALTALPAPSRDAVRLASLLTAPTRRDLDAAGVPPTALDPVEEAGLVEVTAQDAVRFAHPVHAAAVRAGIPPGVRRRLHRTLADIVADPDERALHLARCTMTADAAIAAELAEAADRAKARGAPELAVQLYERAADLTPPQDAADRHDRRLAAVRCCYDSGDYSTAGRRADAVAAGLTGDQQAEALLLRAAVAWSADDLDAAVDAATRGLAVVAQDTPLAGRIHAHLSVFVDVPEQARSHAEAAMALLADSEDDRALLAAVLMLLFHNEVRSGSPARLELLDRALAVEGSEPAWLAGTIPAIWWKARDEHDRARDRLEWMLERAIALGDEPSQHELFTHLGDAELQAGRFTAAAERIAAARELGEQLGTGLAGETWLAGLLDVHVGRLAEADRTADAGLRRAEESGDAWCRRINLQLKGFAAMAAGRMDVAAVAFGELATAMDEAGMVEPLGTRFEADWIEACVGAGDLVTAGRAVDRLAARHTRLPRPWTGLGLARGRVLLASATGADIDTPLEQLAAERAAVPVDVVPFERARCLLVAGLALRRAKRKRAARDALTAAGAEFDALGAAGFAERARAEAARIGGRPAAPLHLTATEDKVALLAAQGRTNRAIADALFVSPKTVEANLARVYRKLGISSRAELGAAMAGKPEGDT